MSKAIKEKEVEYFKYVQEHIENVKNVFRALYLAREDHLELLVINDDMWTMVSQLIDKHDYSKSGVEFAGYRQFFCPADFETKNQTQFNYAWNHHQKFNPHHWEYWVMYRADGSVALEMPMEYVIEMMCDWTAMSVKFNNKPSDWYEKEKSKILMHDNTANEVERFIPVFDDVYLNLIGKE